MAMRAVDILFERHISVANKAEWCRRVHLEWPKTFSFVQKSQPEGISDSSETLASRAKAVADLLSLHGVVHGDRVALWLSSGQDQVAAILGCWMAGAAFCVLPSYAGRTDTERAQERVENVLSVLQPKLILQSPHSRLKDSLTAAINTVDIPAYAYTTDSIAYAGQRIGSRAPDDLAFVQFTSGSTGGDARGAEVRFNQLEANLDALAQRTGMSGRDCMVSWAPLYHDMGLMAVLLSIRTGADLVLMETDHFVRRPGAWLEALTKYKGTVTTAPPTALKLLTLRRAANVDLASLRYAWIGGEAVFPSVLTGFEDCYAAAGLAKGVLQPTYGMAETVVGISCGEPGTGWTETEGVVSCGPPLDGLAVEILDETGAPAVTGDEGMVMVRGASVISGYLGQPRRRAGDWFDTGDLGFMKNGHLFITGRRKDVLKRGAESYPAALIETIAEDALGLRTGRAAAFANRRADVGKEEIVLLVESTAWTDQSARQVAAAVMQELGLQIDVIRNTRGGRFPRTSSGKLMRQMTAALYRKGQI